MIVSGSRAQRQVAAFCVLRLSLFRDLGALQRRQQHRAGMGQDILGQISELDGPCLAEFAAMGHIKRPKARLIQGVPESRFALFELCDEMLRERDDEEARHFLIFVTPVRKAKLSIAVPVRESARAIEVVEYFLRREGLKQSYVNTLARQLPH